MGEDTEKQIRKILNMNFFFFTPQQVALSLLVYYLSEGFQAHLECFWSYYWLKPALRQLRSCKCEFYLKYKFVCFIIWGGGGGGHFWSTIKKVGQSDIGSGVLAHSLIIIMRLHIFQPQLVSSSLT